MGGLVAAYKKRPVKQPVFDGIQVLIGYSSVQVPSTMNRPSDRLISRPTISPGVCRSVLRAAYRMSVLFLPCAFSVSFFVCFYRSTVLLMRKAHVSHVLHCNSAYILFCPNIKKKCRKLAFSALWKHKYMISAWRTAVHDVQPSDRTARVFELFSLDTPGFSGFLPLSYPVCGP